MTLTDKFTLTFFILVQLQLFLFGWWVHNLQKRIDIAIQYLVKRDQLDQEVILEEMRTRVTYEDGC